MGVPAHDERDLEFARKFDLPIIARSFRPPGGGRRRPASSATACAINSPLIDGLSTPEAKERITAWLEEQGLGRRTINYKLRDWLFSRQRYWGEPFPIVWRDGKHEAIPGDRSCRWSRRRWMISNRPAPASRRWPGRRNGFATPTPQRARRTRCRNGPARAGITCAFAIRKNSQRFVGERSGALLDGRRK